MCSVHVSDGFPKKTSLDVGWVGGVNSIQVYFGFLEVFFNFAKPLSTLKVDVFMQKVSP